MQSLAQVAKRASSIAVLTVEFWQVSAGSLGRDYSDRFLSHGLAFVGGKEPSDDMGKVRAGDVMILKRGQSEILAVGEVVERDGRCNGRDDKSWLRDFDGWDLSSWCYVDWRVPKKSVSLTGRPLTRSTINKTWQPQLIGIANRLLAEVSVRDYFEPEPIPTNSVSDEELVGFLIRHGLRPSAAEELTQQMRRIRLLAGFYLSRPWKLTKEHEARSFLVVPLLLALGWAEQRIQIELKVSGVGRADIACFRKPVVEFGQDEDCVLLIETKGLDQGLDYAPKQAQAYAEKFESCNVVFVTNGYCYKAFRRNSDRTFSLQPSAYLNIRHPQDAYPIDPTKRGAIEVLKMLMPGQSG